ncbi:hypothetical protein POM88_004057 [Heracleum sosnowskyi]|uniref:Uncharacterized protein n=1 Tax=Heracleum sosnowskyi TaxID=360622 RepID=A0AAD8JHA5_9APIA|nr:hypothetical protein POM88_004057 [Heracleum sosnowskyi]
MRLRYPMVISFCGDGVMRALKLETCVLFPVAGDAFDSAMMVSQSKHRSKASCMQARSVPVDGSISYVKKNVNDIRKKYEEKIMALWGNIKHSGPSPGVGHFYVDSTMPLKTEP